MEPQATLTQALQTQRAGDFSQAEQLFRKILQANPGDADASNGLGIVLAQQGRLEEAAGCFLELLSRSPEDVKAHNNLGLVRARQGRSEEAVSSFRRALRHNPEAAAVRSNLANVVSDLPSQDGNRAAPALEGEHRQQAQAFNQQGIALARQGQLAEAATWFDRARELCPDFPEPHNNRGNVFLSLRQFDEARTCYLQALRLHPNYADAHHNLGIALGQLKDWEGAAASYRRALALNPDKAEAHQGLGVALKNLGQTDEALGCYRRAVLLNPDYAEGHNSLGIGLQEQGQYSQAVESFQRAVALKPDFVDALGGLGNALQCLGTLDEAVASYERALAFDPNHVAALIGLGNIRREQGRLEEALELSQQALQAQPACVEAHLYQGNVFKTLGRLDEAIACFQEGLRLGPGSAGAHNNLGTVLEQQGKFAQALVQYEEAIRLDPEDAEIRFNRAMLWLLQGDWDRGWPEYEWRWRMKASPPRRLPQPRWDGSALNGRTILLYAEQGLGDTLQFVRYAPLVKERGGTVLVECQPPLCSLLSSCPGIDRVLPRGAVLPPFDAEAPLLSLAGIFHTTPATVPAKVPYLTADARLVEQWRQELRTFDSALRVGILWQGNPQFPADRLRSIPLTQFAPLAHLEGVQLFSLQVGPGARQLADLGERLGIVDLGSRFEPSSLADVAAVVMNVDLLISSCTSVPHLAGALGVPVWLALPFVPDCRWLLHREDSPWYPRHRLFRQQRPGTWEEVFERLAQEVQKLVAGRSVREEKR